MKLLGSCLLLFAVLAINANADPVVINLGTAAPFAVLGGSTVTNTGPSVITGNVGLSPGTSVTGFPPGTVLGTIHAADAVAAQAQADLTTAYNQAASLAPTQTLTGTNLGGLTLTPGVYFFASSADLTGNLILDAQGDPNALFVFQIGSTLTTASNSSLVYINGGQGGNTFWQVGSSATFGTFTEFQGNVLALTSITLNTGANIRCGRALAQNGAVTLDSNIVSIDTPGCVTGGDGGDTQSTPEPAALLLLGTGLTGTASLLRRRRLKRKAAHAADRAAAPPQA
jgi:hypothetical protein